ncbi:MAG: replication/maintenance protein RepL [Enterococcus sp.]|nr:replication/maintenance protein RepL [Enterococcus sp.]
MSLQSKRNSTIYQGTERWVKLNDDGTLSDKIIETDTLVKEVSRTGFEITYLSYFFDLFEQLGGKRYLVFKYILEHKNTENQLIITNRELAEKCKVSTKTVTETIKLLRDANLIETRTGAIMLNPKLSHRGSNEKERFLLQQFVTFSEE